jgi:transposase
MLVFEASAAKRFLSPSQGYEIWIGLLRGEYTTIEAAQRAGVDRTTIMRVRQTP